jgi:hypothetical protein
MTVGGIMIAQADFTARALLKAFLRTTGISMGPIAYGMTLAPNQRSPLNNVDLMKRGNPAIAETLAPNSEVPLFRVANDRAVSAFPPTLGVVSVLTGKRKRHSVLRLGARLKYRVTTRLAFIESALFVFSE